MNLKQIDLSKNLEKMIPNLQKVENEDGSVVYLGNQFQDTKQFPLSTILLFLERDIFQANRRTELPQVDVQFGIMKNGNHDEIRIQVRNIEGLHSHQESELAPVLSIESHQSTFLLKAKTDYAQQLVTSALAKLTEILWRYNRFKFSANQKFFETRFVYRVLLSDEICRIAQN